MELSLLSYLEQNRDASFIGVYSLDFIRSCIENGKHQRWEHNKTVAIMDFLFSVRHVLRRSGLYLTTKSPRNYFHHQEK